MTTSYVKLGVALALSYVTMFPNKQLNAVLLVGFVLPFAGALLLGRQGTFVGDEGFLKSMIPHHSRAILVCQEATLTDPEIQQLCAEIVQTQEEEIAQMKEMLRRY